MTKLTDIIIHVWCRESKSKKTDQNWWNPCQSE